MSLAAPTGCAAFQMKSGAATIHRVHGVPCGPIVRTSKEARRKSERFKERSKRLEKASLNGFDEFSMIGRQMIGKVLYRSEEIFEDSTQRGFFPDRDCMLSGDTKQASPVADELFCKTGAYTGRAEKRPKKEDVQQAIIKYLKHNYSNPPTDASTSPKSTEAPRASPAAPRIDENGLILAGGLAAL